MRRGAESESASYARGLGAPRQGGREAGSREAERERQAAEKSLTPLTVARCLRAPDTARRRRVSPRRRPSVTNVVGGDAVVHQAKENNKGVD